MSDARRAQRPRMKDVAERAGVSLGTVSHVLNHPHRVAPATIERVHRAIEELGFKPDQQARSLAGGANALIGFVVLDLANSYFVDMARGAEDEASSSGMHVMIADSAIEPDKELAYLQMFQEARAAGILLSPHHRRSGDADHPEWPRPMVLVNTTAGPDRCSVVPDDELGGYLAVRHLVSTGRRRLVFAAGLLHLDPISRRLAGARRAVAETAGAATLDVVTLDGLRTHHGHQLAAQLLARPAAERPDGVFAAADLLALGIVQALGQHPGLRVPDHLAVVGYDDNKEAWASPVPLTTLAQPGYEIGRAAARALIEEVRAPSDHTHRRILVEPQLVVRASTTPQP